MAQYNDTYLTLFRSLRQCLISPGATAMTAYRATWDDGHDKLRHMLSSVAKRLNQLYSDIGDLMGKSSASGSFLTLCLPHQMSLTLTRRLSCRTTSTRWTGA